MTDFRIAAVAAGFLASAALPALAQQAPRDTGSPAQGATTQQGSVSDALVHKVGTALRQASDIRQKYSARAGSASTPEQKQALSGQAETEMLKAINDQGLSVQQYNQVIQMAQADPTLRQRLLSAAQSGG